MPLSELIQHNSQSVQSCATALRELTMPGGLPTITLTLPQETQFTDLQNLTQNTQVTQIKSLQLSLHLYSTHYTNSQLVNYTKWQSSVCRCAMLCYHNIDHLWHGKIYTYTITQKRIPCAGAQCCAFTTLTTSDTEKVQKCHPVQWLTATQNIHFWVPVIVKLSHNRI